MGTIEDILRRLAAQRQAANYDPPDELLNYQGPGYEGPDPAPRDSYRVPAGKVRVRPMLPGINAPNYPYAVPPLPGASAKDWLTYGLQGAGLNARVGFDEGGPVDPLALAQYYARGGGLVREHFEDGGGADGGSDGSSGEGADGSTGGDGGSGGGEGGSDGGPGGGADGVGTGSSADGTAGGPGSDGDGDGSGMGVGVGSTSVDAGGYGAESYNGEGNDSGPMGGEQGDAAQAAADAFGMMDSNPSPTTGYGGPTADTGLGMGAYGAGFGSGYGGGFGGTGIGQAAVDTANEAFSAPGPTAEEAFEGPGPNAAFGMGPNTATYGMSVSPTGMDDGPQTAAQAAAMGMNSIAMAANANAGPAIGMGTMGMTGVVGPGSPAPGPAPAAVAAMDSEGPGRAGPGPAVASMMGQDAPEAPEAPEGPGRAGPGPAVAAMANAPTTEVGMSASPAHTAAASTMGMSASAPNAVGPTSSVTALGPEVGPSPASPAPGPAPAAVASMGPAVGTSSPGVSSTGEGGPLDIAVAKQLADAGLLAHPFFKQAASGGRITSNDIARFWADMGRRYGGRV